MQFGSQHVLFAEAAVAPHTPSVPRELNSRHGVSSVPSSTAHAQLVGREAESLPNTSAGACARSAPK